MHQLMAATLDRVLPEIRQIQEQARNGGFHERPRWPMIVLRTPKGWTGPKEVDGLPVEGTWRAHQVPMGDMDKPAHIKILETWMKSYRPEELFDEGGRLRPELAALAPAGTRAHGRQPARQRRRAAGRSAVARFLRLRRGRAASRGGHRRGHPRPRAVPSRRGQAECRAPQLPHVQPRRDRPRTAGTPCWKRPTGNSTARSSRATTIWPRKAGRWRCSASTSARDGSKAISSPAGTASSPATRRSSTSSIRCSISTPSGSSRFGGSSGGGRSRR